MFIFLPVIPILPFAVQALGAIVPIAAGIGGLIVAPAVLKASSNALNLIKDGKVGLDAQKIIKRISEYDEQIGTIIIDKDLQFDHELCTKEIQKIKENISKLEEKNKALEELKTSNQ